MSDERIFGQLGALIVRLSHNQETHAQWRDCDQEFRDKNPNIGDKEFHARAYQQYAEMIQTAEKAITEITRLERERAELCATLSELKKRHGKHLYAKATVPVSKLETLERELRERNLPLEPCMEFWDAHPDYTKEHAVWAFSLKWAADRIKALREGK